MAQVHIILHRMVLSYISLSLCYKFSIGSIPPAVL